MAKYLFRSRWIALLWALSICFTISRFFGEGGGQEKLEATAHNIGAQRMAQARQEDVGEYYAQTDEELTEGASSEAQVTEAY